MYNPTIQKIEVLKLEKRLDENLQYLQDCPPEYSTIPFDYEPVRTVAGATVPVNTIKVSGQWAFVSSSVLLESNISPTVPRYL